MIETLTETLTETLWSLGPRLALNVVATWLLLVGAYPRGQRSDEQVFSFWLLNSVVFGVVATLFLVRIDIGLGLGLFGVFGILRYRTESMQGRDLTVLFAVIGVAMLCAVATSTELLLRVGAVIGLILCVTTALGGRRRASNEGVTVHYDRTDLLARERRPALMLDLTARLGAPVRAVTVRRVDLVKHSAELFVVLGSTTGAPPPSSLPPTAPREPTAAGAAAAAE